MSTTAIENTNVKRLALALEDDIRRRGLRPGDRYLTASEAVKHFKASEMSVHRAMQLLAEKNLLVRQRGAGTFVGSNFDLRQDQWCPLQVIHVVMSMDCQRIATLPAELLVDRLGNAIPDAVVEVHYVPDYDSLRHLDRIVSRIGGENESKEALILIRSSRSMQLYVQNSGLPAIVFGGVFSDVKKLSSVDVDQFAIGKLMARYVLNAGGKRLALLMRDDWRHGDNVMFSGVTQELGRGGIGCESFIVRSIPPDNDHIAEEVRQLMSQVDAPEALMCRTHMYAAAADQALRSLNLEDTVLLVAGGGRKPIAPRYAYVAPEVDEEDQVEMLGRMLLDQIAKETPHVENRVIPVHMCLP